MLIDHNLHEWKGAARCINVSAPTSLNYTRVHYEIRFYKVLKGKASPSFLFAGLLKQHSGFSPNIYFFIILKQEEKREEDMSALSISTSV